MCEKHCTLVEPVFHYSPWDLLHEYSCFRQLSQQQLISIIPAVRLRKRSEATLGRSNSGLLHSATGPLLVVMVRTSDVYLLYILCKFWLVCATAGLYAVVQCLGVLVACRPNVTDTSVVVTTNKTEHNQDESK